MNTLIVLRWTARLVSFFALILLGVIAIGEGLLQQTGTVVGGSVSQLFMMGCLTMAIAGLLVGWIWEAQGGALAIGGIVTYYALGWSGTANLPSGWFVPILGIPAVLFFSAGVYDATKQRPPDRPDF